MKRILKGLILAAVGVLGLTLASCGEKTKEPTIVPTEPAQHEHSVGTEWKRDSAIHWQECSGCDELVNSDVHDYNDWKLATDKCVKTRDCKVCGYVETADVDHKWVDGVCTVCGEELLITQYYVRGSFGGSDWPALDEYKVVIDYASASATVTVTLPEGAEFKVADANWSAEFNFGTIKAAEGLFVAGDGSNIKVVETAEYKIVLTKLDTTAPECEITQLCVHEFTWTKVDGKTCDYTGVCSKCGATSTKVEHAGYGEWTLVEGKTCDYEQVCACGDKKTKVEHTWGDDIVCDKCQAVNVVQYYVRGDMNGWGATDESALVLGADKKSASILLVVEAGQGFKIASSDWAHEFNFDTITFNVAGFEKAADSNNIVASKAGVYMVNVAGLDTLEPTCTIDPVQLYVRGDMNGWGTDANYALVYDKETDTATFTLELADITQGFKIASPEWDVYNKHYNIGALGDGKYGYGTAEVDAGNIKFTETGFYLIKVANVTTGEPVVTIEKTEGTVEPVVVPVPELWVRGSFDEGWAALDAYKLVANAEAKTASVKVYLAKDTEFKVASSDWTFEFNGGTAKFAAGLLEGSGNMKVLVGGYYLFTVNGTDDKVTATCTIELVAQDATSTYKPADDTYGKVVTEAGAVVDTLALWRIYIVVDAEGRIAYMCDMPKNGYGNPASTSYARHSVYADYKTNPAFKDLGSEPYDEWGNVEYKVVVPEGGFAITEIHGGTEPTTSFIKLISGKDYAEHSVNSSAVNVDNIRLSHKDGKITVTVLGATEVKTLSVEEVKALTSDTVVVVSGVVAKDESGYNAITDGTNVISFYKNYDHLHAGDEFTVVAQYSAQYKNLQNFQLVKVTKENAQPLELDLTEVTSVDQLVDGAKVVLVGGENMATDMNSGNYLNVAPANDPCVKPVTLVKSGDNWILQVAEGQNLYYNASAGGNKVSCGNVEDDSAKWTITIAEGVMTIENVGTAGRKLQYNSSSPRFACYTSTQVAPKLFVVNEANEPGLTSGSIVLNDITAVVETFTDKATLNSITGYESDFTFTDGVIVRVNGDKTKISRLELNKNGAGVISFNTGSKITLSITVKGTGSSNTCVFAVAVNGQYIVANEDAIPMECTQKDTTEAEQTAGVLYSYTESETVIDSNGNEKAGATAENMYATYGGDEVTVTFTIDASAISGGALVEILSPACIQGRGIGITALSVSVAE